MVDIQETLLGRNDSWIDQPTGAEPVSFNTKLICAFCGGQGGEGDLVLRLVSPFSFV